MVSYIPLSCSYYNYLHVFPISYIISLSIFICTLLTSITLCQIFSISTVYLHLYLIYLQYIYTYTSSFIRVIFYLPLSLLIFLSVSFSLYLTLYLYLYLLAYSFNWIAYHQKSFQLLLSPRKIVVLVYPNRS